MAKRGNAVIDQKAFQLAAQVVANVWEEAVFLSSLTPLENARYHKLRLALYLKHYEEFPNGELKDFLSSWVPMLKEALTDRKRLEEWTRIIGSPDFIREATDLQKVIMGHLENET